MVMCSRTRFMRVLSALCAAALIIAMTPCAARAEFSPGLSALDGQPIQILVTARLENCSPYPSAVTERLSALVERMSVRMLYESQPGQTASYTELAMDGDPLISFGQLSMNGLEWVTLSPLEDTVLSGLTAEGQTPLDALLGEPDSLLSRFAGYAGGLEAALSTALPAALENLSEYAKESRYQKNIKNVGTSTYRIVYSVPKSNSADAFRLVGRALLSDDRVSAVIGSVRGALPAFHAFLDGLRISSTLVITRYQDADHQDIGLAVTCTFATEEINARKLTVLIGGMESDTKGGAYIYITAPAASGSNAFKILYTRKSAYGDTKNTLTANLDYTRRVGSVKDVVDASASMTNKHSDTDENWSGTIKATHTHTENGESVKHTYQIKPALTFVNAALTGTMELLVNRADKTLIEGEIGLHVQAGESVPAWNDRYAILDVGELDQQAIHDLRERVTASLSGAVFRVLSTLSYEDAMLITYDLGQEDWQTITTGGEDAYLVEEESGT